MGSMMSSASAVSSTSTEATDLKMAEESKKIDDIKKALENNDTYLAVSLTNKYLEDRKNIPLNIAITGKSGAGKSTFVNAFRGIDNKDERAAPTGVVETTYKPEPYQHPIHPTVTIWDLPGVGTTNFKADEYLKLVEFEKFDFFILVSANRFSEDDAKLAKDIKKMGKKFYFVRSKIEHNLRNAQKGKTEYDEEKKLKEIRENCIQGLEKQDVTSPQVFLVSSFDLHLYDFPALQDTMERELPQHKRDVLMLALPNICKSTIDKKKEVFRSRIKYFALLSASAAAVPIPGVSIAADVGILVGVLQEYLLGFGLDKTSLEKMSTTTKIPLEDLRAVLKCLCSGKNVTKELVVLMLQSVSAVMVCKAAEEGSRWIPFLGIPIAAALSYGSIYWFLSSTLDSLSVDAENILMRALDIK